MRNPSSQRSSARRLRPGPRFVTAVRRVVVGPAAALSLAASFVPIAAYAHHGWSDYDEARPVTLSGPIDESRYENPHATIVMHDGDQRYEVVLAPVARMEARGAPRAALAVGETVRVVGYPSRSHPGEVRAERITWIGARPERTVELR